jgi:hypothetical protein
MSSWFGDCKPNVIKEACTFTTTVEQQCPLKPEESAVYIGIAVLAGLLLTSIALHLLVFLGFIEVRPWRAEEKQVERSEPKESSEERTGTLHNSNTSQMPLEESVFLFRDEICVSLEDLKDRLSAEIGLELREMRRNIQEQIHDELMKQSVSLRSSHVRRSQRLKPEVVKS